MMILLSSCETVPLLQGKKNQSGKNQEEEKDRGPEVPVNVSHIAEPTPRVEPRTRAGNSSPYKVLGSTYHVIQNPQGYRKSGVASWYGQKFHGRRTANGEIYDMYGMTAAHKTLPIPSYVRVTNTGNKMSVIVRINDRGPFHTGRVIDLSYTAAKKLGFERVGTAKVIVEYIDPLVYKREKTQTLVVKGLASEPSAPTPENSAGYKLPDNTWLQVGAYGTELAASKMKQRLQAMTRHPIVVIGPRKGTTDKLHRVRVGPFKDNFELMSLREKVMQAKLPEPHVVYH